MTAFGCVVLTQGRRPEQLRAAVASLLAQEGVEVDVAVVGNGWAPAGLPGGVHAVALPEDVGIPGGRNAGVGAVRGELLRRPSVAQMRPRPKPTAVASSLLPRAFGSRNDRTRPQRPRPGRVRR